MHLDRPTLNIMLVLKRSFDQQQSLELPNIGLIYNYIVVARNLTLGDVMVGEKPQAGQKPHPPENDLDPPPLPEGFAAESLTVPNPVNGPATNLAKLQTSIRILE